MTKNESMLEAIREAMYTGTVREAYRRDRVTKHLHDKRKSRRRIIYNAFVCFLITAMVIQPSAEARGWLFGRRGSCRNTCSRSSCNRSSSRCARSSCRPSQTSDYQVVQVSSNSAPVAEQIIQTPATVASRTGLGITTILRRICGGSSGCRRMVMVSHVDSGSTAQQLGIVAGDQIESVNGQKVTDTSQADSALSRNVAEIVVNHDGASRVVAVPKAPEPVATPAPVTEAAPPAPPEPAAPPIHAKKAEQAKTPESAKAPEPTPAVKDAPILPSEPEKTDNPKTQERIKLFDEPKNDPAVEGSPTKLFGDKTNS